MSVGLMSFASPPSAQAAAIMLKVGAGGWLRGGDIHPDGTMVTRTDTYGGYVYDTSLPNPGNAGGTGAWRQLITPSSMPASDPGTTVLNAQTFVSNLGIYEIQIARSSSSTFYMLWNGYAYKSTDKGKTWANLTGFTTAVGTLTNADMQANGNYTINGPKMVIDPINASRVFLGLQTKGAYKTLDGGASFSKITSIPNPTAQTAVLFIVDPRASQQSGGNSQVIYAASIGNGIYKSTDAGATFSLISGSPTSIARMMVDVTNGNLWVTTGASGNGLMKYNGSSWSTPTLNNNGNPAQAIAFDPSVSNSQRLMLGATAGELMQSIDGGTTWTGSYGPPSGLPGDGTNSGAFGPTGLTATDIPWLNTEQSFSLGDIQFDASGVLHAFEGVGHWTASPPTTFTNPANWKWTSQSAGIEQLVANMIVCPAGGYPVLASYDRALFTITDDTKYPTSYYPVGFTNPPGATSVCYVPSAPANLFATIMNGSLCKSTDKGLTWSTSGTAVPSTAQGGWAIAAASTSLLVVVQPGGDPYYSSNGGGSWNSLANYFQTNFGIATGGNGWCGFSNNQNIQQICADENGVIYVWNANAGASGGGIYSTTIGSAWTRKSTNDTGAGLSASAPGGNPMLIAVPGKPGTLIWCGGQTYQGSHPYTAASNCKISTDGGATWSDLNANLRDVWTIGVGKQVGSYPRMVAWGWLSSVPGVFYSDDMGASWTKICEQTLYGTFDVPKFIAVDNDTGKNAYVGLTGSGYAKVRLP